jgi:electron transport complex protein RnfD
MLDVIIALVPAMIAAVYLFRMDAVRLIGTCVAACVLTEFLCRKAMGRDAGVADLSAIITGILLAFNLPPSLPTWMAIVGSVAAIAIAKQVFGGIGYNPFNPALVGRVVLLISCTAAMTTWDPPAIAQLAADATTTATPLGLAKHGGPFALDTHTMLSYFLGNKAGCLGEVSVLALLLGGAYLLFRRVISWQTPISYIATVAVLSGILWAIDSESNMPPHFHLLTGGLMLGAIFMATDMVTSPVTRKGMLFFGCGCGFLTVIIRKWGGYPEGVSFAILLMNAITPLINSATRPRIFGKRKAESS